MRETWRRRWKYPPDAGRTQTANPSNAAGILCTIKGFSNVPEGYRSGIPAMADEKFAEVKYTWNTLIPTCTDFARRSIERAGGSTKTVNGRETFFIPEQTPEPLADICQLSAFPSNYTCSSPNSLTGWPGSG